MSLADLAALRREWRAKERREDYRTGVIVALLANVNRDPKTTKPFHPADWFPSLEDLRPPPPSEDDLWNKLEAAFS